MEIDPKISPFFTKLRNQVRTCELEDSLFVIWAYIRNLQEGKAIPHSIEVHPKFRGNSHSKRAWVTEWDLEFLLSLVIVYAEPFSRIRKTMKNLRTFGKVMDSIRKLDNQVSKIVLAETDVFSEMRRITFRQFDWQAKLNMHQLARYHKIYSQLKLAQIIQKRTGMSYDHLVMIGMALANVFSQNGILKLPITSQIPGITQKMIEDFLTLFASKREALKNLIRDNLKVTHRMFYSFNPIKSNPILLYAGKAYCPIPRHIFNQLTSGLYYSLFSEKGFSSAFGIGFQEYIGLVIKKLNDSFSILPEAQYGGKNKKDTIDWIVKGKTEILFIECKTKRVSYHSKSGLDFTENDVNAIASAIFQSYKTIMDYKSGLYPQLEYIDDRKEFILIVTLEKWYLLSTEWRKPIEDLAIEKLKNHGIPLSIIEEIPYSIISTEEFETDFQVMNQFGINNYWENRESGKFEGMKLNKIFADEILAHFKSALYP